MTDGRNASRFTPRLLPTLAVAALLPLLLWLGSWQLDRAAGKQALSAAFAAAQLAEAVPYSAGLPRFTRVSARGHWDAAHHFLLDAAVHEGRVGFRVLTPLTLDAGGVLMVDRGWVAGDPARRVLPEITLIAPGPVVVEGLTDEFPRAGVVSGTPAATSAWPRLLLYPAPAEFQAALGAPIEPELLRLDPAAPDGYARGFAPDFGMPRERHLAYAFTWFALAVTLFAIWVGTNLRRKEH